MQIDLKYLSLITTLFLAILLCVPFMKALSIAPSICGLFFILGYLIQDKRLPSFDFKITILLSTFIVLAGLSSFWSGNPDFVLHRTFRLLFSFLGGIFLINAINDYPYKKNLHKIFLLATLPFIFVLSVLFIEYNFYQLIYKSVKNIDSAYGIYVTPARLNWLMIAAVAILWPIASHLLFQKKRFLAYLLIITTLLIGSQSLSQSAFLGLICSTLVFTISFFIRKKWLSHLFIIGVIVALFGLPLGLSQINHQHFKADQTKAVHELTRLEIFLRTSSAYERLQIWKFTADQIKKSPFIGHGIEAMRFKKTAHGGIVKEKEWRSVSHPHNGILQLWIEFGVLGITLATLFFTIILKRIAKLPDYSFKAAIATFTALFTIGSVGYGLWQGWWIGTIFLATSYCLTLKKIEENNLQYKL